LAGVSRVQTSHEASRETLDLRKCSKKDVKSCCTSAAKQVMVGVYPMLSRRWVHYDIETTTMAHIYALKSYKTTTTWAATNKQTKSNASISTNSINNLKVLKGRLECCDVTHFNKFWGVVLEIGGDRVSQMPPWLSWTSLILTSFGE
jgi:hypothetical protein